MDYTEIVGLVNYPGYGVSRDGSVWSVWGVRGKGTGNGRGSIPYIGTEWWRVTPTRASNGYLHVILRRARRLVHRLVLEAFVGPPPKAHQAAHWNGIRSDNRLDNLRWATPKENAADKVRHGTIPRSKRKNRRVSP